MSKLVKFLYEVGNLDTKSIELCGCTFRRFEPVNVSTEFYRDVIACAWRYKFDVRGAIVTDFEDPPAYSDHLYTGNITAIIPHYKTLHLTRQAVASLKVAYPDMALIVVDDGSTDGSTEFVRSLPDEFHSTSVLILDRNVGHGAALHRAIMEVKTDLFLAMDSDIIVHRPGFLELMETRLRCDGLYAIGTLYWRDFCHGLMYLTSVFGLYDLKIYHTLPPFEHHGDPMRSNMLEADKRGLRVECFPVFDYVTHLEAGTRRFVSPDNPDRWDFTGG